MRKPTHRSSGVQLFEGSSVPSVKYLISWCIGPHFFSILPSLFSNHFFQSFPLSYLVYCSFGLALGFDGIRSLWLGTTVTETPSLSQFPVFCHLVRLFPTTLALQTQPSLSDDLDLLLSFLVPASGYYR